jgi:hypothetical protein
VVKDIAVLASMHKLTAQLSPEAQAVIQPRLQEAIMRQQLPDGVRVELETEVRGTPGS